MPSLTAPVTYAGVTKPVSIDDGLLQPFLHRALQAFSLPPPAASTTGPLLSTTSSMSCSLTVSPSSSSLCSSSTSSASSSPSSSLSSLPSIAPFSTTPPEYNAPTRLQLAFQTNAAACSAITTDLALRLALRAPVSSGSLVLVDAHDLPSIDDSVHTVLKAVADTAARRDAAAVFVALSGAWERAVRDAATDFTSSDSEAPSPSARFNASPQTPLFSSTSSPPTSSTPPSHVPPPTHSHTQGQAPAQPQIHTQAHIQAQAQTHAHNQSQAHAQSQYARFPHVPDVHPQLHHHRSLHGALTRALDGALNADTARAVADATVGRAGDAYCAEDSGMWEAATHAAAETRALACFCTHAGVACSECNVQPITGTRYRRCAPSSSSSSSASASTSTSASTPPASAAAASGSISAPSAAQMHSASRAASAAAAAAAAAAAINLCERCRRALADADLFGDDDASFVVYDHPWEASDEYTSMCSGAGLESGGGGTGNGSSNNSSGGGSGVGGGTSGGSIGGGVSTVSGAGATAAANPSSSSTSGSDTLRAPPPPLRQGDVGPRVLHLHYVLYKVGYLSLGRPCFRPGVFCAGTSEAVGKFQTDHWVAGMAGQLGVYSAVTRTVLLSILDEQERRAARVRCSAISGAEGPRLRMALAA